MNGTGNVGIIANVVSSIAFFDHFPVSHAVFVSFSVFRRFEKGYFILLIKINQLFEHNLADTPPLTPYRRKISQSQRKWTFKSNII
mgnify:CR=1 FL=1